MNKQPVKDEARARFIYFAGVDGCGKSSIIDELIKEYKKRGITAKRVWLRFNYFFTKPVLLYCRLAGYTRRERKGGKMVSIHDFHKSRLIALLVQYLHLVDTVLAYLIYVWIPMTFTDKVILCDKFVYDILADFMVETRDLDLLNRNITNLFLKLVPSGVPIIFYTVDKDEIIRRKPEVLIDDEDYDFKYDVYRRIMNKFGRVIIRNDDFNKTVLETKKIINLQG